MKSRSSGNTFHVHVSEVQLLRRSFYTKAYDDRCLYNDLHASLKDLQSGRAYLKLDLKQTKHDKFPMLISAEPRVKSSSPIDMRNA